MQEPFGNDGNSAGFVYIGRDKPSGGLQISQQWRPLADSLKIIHGQDHSGFARNREQVKNCVGGAPRAGNTGNSKGPHVHYQVNQGRKPVPLK